MTNLKGKSALVTGASAGIGKATALLLAKKGVRVFALGRRKEKLEDLQKQNASIIPVVADINLDNDTIDALLAKNRIDILINNAGLALGRDSFQDAKQSDIETMFQTNVMALIKMSKKVLPQMIERKTGDIINVGSIAGTQAYAGGTVYCTTKAAVDMLTDGMRFDLLGKGVRVTQILPGMVDTEFSLVRFRGDKKLADKVYEGMRALQPEDVAEAIVWALERPSHVDIHSMLIMPTDQGGIGAIHRAASN